MSRVLKVYNSDYKIAVRSGGKITLDSASGELDGNGNPTGTIVVNGNLEVKGTTTTVDSQTVTIEDNIIVLSHVVDEDDSRNGLPSSVSYKSGIEIDRGNYPAAQWLFYEQISWDLGGTSGAGTFYATDTTGQTLPLATSGIVLNGADNLYVTTGNGVISVTNTNNYEEKIFNYAGVPATITPNAQGEIVVDNDHIPNAKSLVDYIDYSFANATYRSIANGDTRVDIVDYYHELDAILNVGTETTIRTVGQHGFTVLDTIDIIGVSALGDLIENLNGVNLTITEVVSPTVLKVDVDTTGGNTAAYIGGAVVQINGFDTQADEPRIKLQVSGVVSASLYDNRTEIHNLKLQDTEISVTDSNADLLLSANGTGTVKVKDILELGATPWDDDPFLVGIVPPADGVKIYTGASGQTPGNTGIYYVNSNEVRDELVSKNRALLYSMIF